MHDANQISAIKIWIGLQLAGQGGFPEFITADDEHHLRNPRLQQAV